jgi:hypothetical protein
MNKQDILSNLKKELPPVVYRNFKRFKELTGYSPRSIANLDCQGMGPTERVYCGRVAGYPRESLINWLSQRMQVVDKEAGHAETDL